MLESEKMNSGDVAWVSIATGLVMLMTPALGFFYAGLVRKKNLISILAQCFAIFAIVSLTWTLWGYSLSFGSSINGVIGDLSLFDLNTIEPTTVGRYARDIPELLYFAFELMFAAITPALIIGAFAERIKFRSLLIFTVLWSTFIYAPIAHWVWNADGWIRALGAIDFAGGLVVHVAAGASALAAALVIGKRKGFEKRDEFKPSSVAFVLLGAALLWFGWFGFNGGSAFAANEWAVSAIVNTNLSAAAATASWMIVDWVTKGKPSATGMAIGGVCGLVAITPGSGFVSVPAAIIIGLVAGFLCNRFSNWRVLRTKLDDALDVFACHGIGGIWGSISTGLFASATLNPHGADGLFYGNPSLLLVQCAGVLVVTAFALVGSYLLLRLVNVFMPLRVSPEEEEAGLDLSQHGEEG
jgi:Amt family ammonium transporter